MLTSLIGAPRSIGGVFGCSENMLTSLDGFPEKVGGDFYVTYNPDLPQSELDKYKSNVRGKIINT